MSVPRKAFRILVLFAAIALVSTASFAIAGGLEGKTMYLTANIWYEVPQKIYSTNYHKGSILGAGTKVRVEDISRRAIRFTALDSGTTYTLIYVKKHHPNLSTEEYAKQYFSERNPMAGGKYGGFTENEKRGIRFGKVKKGMSKEAVLMAYGYPPSHRTPSLDNDIWYYWTNRFISEAVYFENGRVFRVE